MNVVSEPAYTRLQTEERRRQLLEAGATLFAEHAFEEISMRQIAQAAGVSKALLYHYFPSKTDLFSAALQDASAQLQHLIAPRGEGAPIEQLARSLDAYLRWIEDNARTWSKLMQSAATLTEASTLVEGFRGHTMDLLLAALIGRRAPRPALRNALKGWLGYMDAAILDWVQSKDLPRAQVQQLLMAAFGAAVAAAQQADPAIKLRLD